MAKNKVKRKLEFLCLNIVEYLTIIRRRRSEYCGIIPETKSRGLFDNILTEREENNCFSKIAQVIIRAIAFSFIFFVSSSKTSRNRAVSILKISASVTLNQ